jgi:branched-chain amino acid transport system ATP-binding protein
MPTSAADPLLEIKGLSAGYGKIGVLSGVDLTIGAGEIVALLGPNGAGKSTLLKAISGLLPRTGSIRFGGQDMSGAGPRDAVNAGLVHVVEGHRVFTQLSVTDNLMLAGYGMSAADRARRVEEALAFFPEIAEKRHERAVTLSGGQQQMLALARAVMSGPRLLLVDEASLGLSPAMTATAFDLLRRLNAETGVAVLLVEQQVHALELAARAYVLEKGTVVDRADGDDVIAMEERLRAAYLGEGR